MMQNIIADYQSAIATLQRETKRAAEGRQWLGEWERKLKCREAQILTTEPPEGKNAEERAANHLLRCTTDDLAVAHRKAIWQARARVDDAEMQVSVARETARLLRLQLALAVVPGVQELLA